MVKDRIWIGLEIEVILDDMQCATESRYLF